MEESFEIDSAQMNKEPGENIEVFSFTIRWLLCIPSGMTLRVERIR